ncbi:MAG: hypothetical protein R2727_05600 [Bacteroidales bacterium]
MNMLLPTVAPIILVIFVLLVVSAAIQLFYNYWFYLRVSLKENTAGGREKEKTCLGNNMRPKRSSKPAETPSNYTSEQDYPDFEVIVVNDCSRMILKRF